MSTVREQQPVVRCDRAPLRDVQNEVAAVQQKTPKTASLQDRTDAQNENTSPVSAPKADSSTSLSLNIYTKNKSGEAVNEHNVTFKSFSCDGGEVELSDTPEISEESVLIKALTLEDHPQTLNNTNNDAEEETEAVMSSTGHTDHPYCYYTPDEAGGGVKMMQDGQIDNDDCKSSVNEQENIILQSFTCSGGEVEITGEPKCGVNMTQDGQIIDDDFKSSIHEQAEVILQSFTCPGEEIEITGEPFMQDASVMSRDGPLDYSESPSHHIDHQYCNYAKEASDESICTHSEIVDASYTVENLDDGGQIQNISTALDQKHGDVTFKSLNFSGVEVEIENMCITSEISMLMKNLTVDDHLQSVSCDVNENDGEITAALNPDSEHVDHIYCCVNDDDDEHRDASTNSLISEPIRSSSDLLNRSKTAEAIGLVNPDASQTLSSELEVVVENSLLPHYLISCNKQSHTDLKSASNNEEASPTLIDPFKQNCDVQFLSEDKETSPGVGEVSQDDRDQQLISDLEENEAKDDLTSTHDSVHQSSSEIKEVSSHVEETVKYPQANVSTSENFGNESVSVHTQSTQDDLHQQSLSNKDQNSVLAKNAESGNISTQNASGQNAELSSLTLLDESVALKSGNVSAQNVDLSLHLVNGNSVAEFGNISTQNALAQNPKCSESVLFKSGNMSAQNVESSVHQDHGNLEAEFCNIDAQNISTQNVESSLSQTDGNMEAKPRNYDFESLKFQVPGNFEAESGNLHSQDITVQNAESSLHQADGNSEAKSGNVSAQKVTALNVESSFAQTDGNLGAESGNLNFQNMPTQNVESSFSQIDGNVEAQSRIIDAQNAESSLHQADGNSEAKSGNVSVQNTSAQNVEPLSSQHEVNSVSGCELVQEVLAQLADGDVEVSVQDSAVESGVHSGSEVLRAECVPDCPVDAVSLHTHLWNILTLQDPSTPKNPNLSRSVLQGHSDENPHSRLWPELPESPMPPPQLNSTSLPQTPPTLPQTPRTHRYKLRGEDGAGVKPPPLDFSSLGKGPLQQQLRQMAELLIVASGKLAAPPTPVTPVQCRNAEAATSPVRLYSAAVGTTPVLQAEQSTNTSHLMDEVKEVEDACTSTDCLLWSVSPSSLQSLSRSEVEQKLLSSLIMVELLSQQLSLAQSHTTSTRPAPSDLRDRLVQTENTQLSKTGPYRDLYVSALERIRTLEEDQDTLQSLHLSMQKMRSTMTGVKTDTQEVVFSLKQIEEFVNDDQEILYKQMSQMRHVYGRCMNTLKKMEEKSRACLQERDDMKRRMEEALQQKETVLRVLEQLRVHHSAQVSDLQHSLGSQQELTAALTHTYPHLVELKQSYVESLSAASVLLKEKLEDHEQLSAELYKAQQLLQKSRPVVQKLQQRAAEVLQQSQLHQAERDRAVEERDQMEAELEQTQSSLQEAEQQITDLNTQITIINSEMSVLREQLCEVEEERAHLQRKSTELSATISSTLASYTFLEQALSSETSKLQLSRHEAQEATERSESLQVVVEESQRRVQELEELLAQREALLSELHTETEHQRLQLRRLTQMQHELSSAREMSEFLQAENELTREQLCESEGLLRSNLQGLRERNLQCEDLRLAIQQLREERDALQDELVSTRDKARVMLLEQGEQLSQATLDVSLLQHRVRCLTTNTHPNTKSSAESAGEDDAQQSSSSLVCSVLMALTADTDTAPPAGPVCSAEEEDQLEGLGSKSSAFTRLPQTAPQHTDDESRRSALVELLAGLGESVSELQSAIEQLKLHKDTQLTDLHNNIRGLQEALKAESDRHREEEAELKQQVGRLRSRVEKDTQVLQQKTQDEKALKKLCSELEENMETAQKHRAENSELKREGAELRRALQESQVEVQALRAELMRSGDQSADGTKSRDDRIRLLREVEKLKAKLMEVEESRSKLLERAKRHQMVHAMNQSKLERELHLLDDMIENVRKTLSCVPEVVQNCPELQNLLQFLG